MRDVHIGPEALQQICKAINDLDWVRWIRGRMQREAREAELSREAGADIAPAMGGGGDPLDDDGAPRVQRTGFTPDPYDPEQHILRADHYRKNPNNHPRRGA